MTDDQKHNCVNALYGVVSRMMKRHYIMFDRDDRCDAVLETIDNMLSDDVLDKYIHALETHKMNHVASILLTAEEIIARNAIEIIVADAKETH